MSGRAMGNQKHSGKHKGSWERGCWYFIRFIKKGLIDKGRKKFMHLFGRRPLHAEAKSSTKVLNLHSVCHI